MDGRKGDIYRKIESTVRWRGERKSEEDERACRKGLMEGKKTPEGSDGRKANPPKGLMEGRKPPGTGRWKEEPPGRG